MLAERAAIPLNLGLAKAEAVSKIIVNFADSAGVAGSL